jgi:hypothetical protein
MSGIGAPAQHRDVCDLLSLRSKWHAALAYGILGPENPDVESAAVSSDIPSGLPQPDGVQRIHNASRKLTAARDEMMKAHKRMRDYMEHGIVPEDLKSGS